MRGFYSRAKPNLRAKSGRQEVDVYKFAAVVTAAGPTWVGKRLKSGMYAVLRTLRHARCAHALMGEITIEVTEMIRLRASGFRALDDNSNLKTKGH